MSVFLSATELLYYTLSVKARWIGSVVARFAVHVP